VNTPSSNSSKFWFIWRTPLILAALTLFALIIALVKTGIWHWVAWVALAAPIIVGFWYSLVRKK